MKENKKISAGLIATIFALQIFSIFSTGCLAISFLLAPKDIGLVHFSSGIPHRCPLCGMTRAFINMAHGNFDKARSYNPLGPEVFILFIFLSLSGIILLPITLKHIKYLKQDLKQKKR